MKIEFIKFDEPKNLNEDTIDYLKNIGNNFFVLLEIESKVRDYTSFFYKLETIKKIVIETLKIHPNVTVLGHKFLCDIRNTKIIGYSKIEFDVDGDVDIKI